LDKLNNLDSHIDEKLSNQQQLLDLLMQKIKRMESYYQFMLVQLVEMKYDEELLPFLKGMIIVKTKDKSQVAEQIRQTADYGENFQLIFNNPGIFLDIGANIGATSFKLASSGAGGGWKGYAFEAGAINADMLERNIKANKFDVKVIKKAVHEKSGKIYFIENGPWGHIETNLIGGSYGEIECRYKEIECISLDDWIETEDIQKIDFIKMDIEGSESAALRGMKKMLTRYNFPPIFCEINSFVLGFYKETQKSLFQNISDLGYKPYQIVNIDGKMSLFEFDIDRQPPLVALTDFLFIKDFVNIKLNVQSFVKEEKEKIVSRIIEQLSYYKSWEFHNYNRPQIETADYICLALRDYPEYLENTEIKKYLSEIKNLKNKYQFLEMCMEWFNPDM
jgi:FkbM family methyltransferase